MTWHVSNDLPFGNGCDFAVREAAGVAEVSFAAEPRNGVETCWFCIRVRRDDAGAGAKTLRLVLKHGGNMLGHAPVENIRPVWRSDGGDWQRLGAGTFHKLAHGPWSLSWTIDAPQSDGELALCYPYGPDNVMQLIAESNGRWQAHTVGVTGKNNPLRRLCNKPGEEPATEPGYYILARQHAGETPGSWVLDGLMRRLATLGDDAPLTWVVPLCDTDGVIAGDYGKDSFPWDFNRAWGQPPMRHEALTLQRDMRLWAVRCEPRFVLDLHAPGMSEGEGVYGFAQTSMDNEAVRDATFQWGDAMQQALGPYAHERFNRHMTSHGKWPTWCCSEFAQHVIGVPAMTVEVPYALCGDIELTRERYQEIGQRLADLLAARA